MDKKIVLVTTYPINDEPVVRNRLSAYILILSEHRYEISLVTTRKSVDNENEKHLPGGISDIIYEDLVEYDRSRFVARAWYEIRLSLSIIRRIKRFDGSIVLTVPSVFLLIALWCANRNNIIVDLRDLVWEYLPGRTLIERTMKSVLRSFALISLKRAKLIVTTNSYELRYIRSRCLNIPSLLVSNGISREQFLRINEIKESMRRDETLRIAYIGNVGLAQNLRHLIDVVKEYEYVEAHIIGAGTDFSNIKEYIKQQGVENVVLHGRLPWSKVVIWYERCDIFYAQLSKDFETAVPSKLYEYLSTGKPIIYGGIGSAVELLGQFESVYIIEPGNHEQLCEAISEIRKSLPFRKSTNNIDKIKRDYIREDKIELFLKYIEGCLEK